MYCMYLTSGTLGASFQQSLHDCMLLLYIVCERYPSARRYRDIFERVKEASTTTPTTQSDYGPRQDIGSLPDAPAFPDPTQTWSDGLSNDLLQMIDDMSGQAVDPFLGLGAQLDPNVRYPLNNTWWM